MPPPLDFAGFGTPVDAPPQASAAPDFSKFGTPVESAKDGNSDFASQGFLHASPETQAALTGKDQPLPTPGEPKPATPAPRDAGWGEVLSTAATQPFRDIGQTYQGITGGKPKSAQPQITAAQPMTVSDIKDPVLLGKKFVYGLLSSSPEMAGAIMGGALGAAPAAEAVPAGAAIGTAAGPVGAVAGSVIAPAAVEAVSIAAGAAIGHAVRAFGPAFGEELAKTPNDPDGAFSRAWLTTGVGSAFTGGSFAAFGIAPFEGAVKNLIFQGFGIQAPIAAGEQAVSNYREGKPLAEGTADAAFSGALGTVGPMAAHAGVRGAAGLLADQRVDPALRDGLEAIPGATQAANERVPPGEMAATPAAAPAPTPTVPGQAAAPERPPARPLDLVTFLINRGGVQDQTGDLVGIGADAVHHRGAGRLVTKNGLTPDYAREAAVEAGFLPQDATVSDLYDAIGDSMSGRPVFSGADTARAIDWRQGQEAQTEADRMADARGPAEEAAKAAGLPLDPDMLDHAATLVMQGEHPDDAVVQALHAAIHAPPAEDFPATTFHSADDEIPFSRRPDGGTPGEVAGQPTQAAVAARGDLTRLAGATMRFMGLPEAVGVKLVDRLYDSAGNEADGHYARQLVTLALDTPPEQMPGKLWHEAIHGLLDPGLGLLTDGERKALQAGADRWLGKSGNEERLRQLGYGDAELRDEAVARMGEESLAAGLQRRTPFMRAYDRITNAVRGIGQVFRGAGYKTSDDVFRGLMGGGRALPGSREALAGNAVQLPQAPPGNQTVQVGDVKATLPDQYLSRRDPVETLREAAPRSILARQALRVVDTANMVSEGIKGAITPMATGTKRAQYYAFQFANAQRGVAYQFGLIDKGIKKSFKAAGREAMGRAMDNQSVFEQRLAEMPPAERAAQEPALRAEFEASGQGVASLPEKQRGVVEQLAALGQTVWQRMRDRGLVAPGAEGLPYWFARQLVMRDEQGTVSRIGGAGGGGSDINEIGRNLTTRGPMAREHLTPEETEAAAKAKFGEGATLIRDIRSVVQKLATNERAIAGADLLSAVKKVGEQAGVNLVVHGDLPGLLEPGDYFTINHPSFRRFTGSGWQDIRVAREFEGPMRAVLSEKPGDLYNAMMKAKGGVMSAIMYSPFMHLGVEIGRALPLMPGKLLTLKFWRDAYTLRNDSDFMATATRDGLAPIGQGWSLDPVRVAEEAATDNAHTPLGKLAELWHGVHQRLLWDQVFNLQVGIYNEMKSRFAAKGFGPDVAGTMAAHLANRYAGALPPENLSRLANQTANLVLFSRSFTLGNLGVIKDMMNGAPSHVRATIEQMAGPAVARSAQSALKRKAIATFALDIGLFYVANAALQQMIAAGQRTPGMGLAGAAASVAQEWADDAKESLSKVGENPLNAFGVLPQHFNEPGKQDRVYMGNDATGRGTYLRLPPGKIGEEFLGWFTHPGPLLMNKLSPFTRPLVEAIFGTDSLGRPIYKPDPKTIGDYISNAGMIAGHLVSDLGPVTQIQGAYNAVTGAKGDAGVETMKAVLPTLGIGQVSTGYPGGPQAGFEAAAKRSENFDVLSSLPKVRDLVKAGDTQGAIDLLQKSGAQGREIRGMIRAASNPGVSLAKWYARHAPDGPPARVTGSQPAP